MILNHIWGLYAHPMEEWKTIDAKRESIVNSLTHILFVALLPCAAAYYASAHIMVCVADFPGGRRLLSLPAVCGDSGHHAYSGRARLFICQFSGYCRPYPDGNPNGNDSHFMD